MDGYIVPYLEGLAERFGEGLEAGIKRIIKKQSYRYPTRYRRQEMEDELRALIPYSRVLIRAATPFIRKRLVVVEENFDFIMEILEEEYPDIYYPIIETEGGREWMEITVKDALEALRRILKS